MISLTILSLIFSPFWIRLARHFQKTGVLHRVDSFRQTLTSVYGFGGPAFDAFAKKMRMLFEKAQAKLKEGVKNPMAKPTVTYTPSFEFEQMHDFPVAGVDEAGIGSWIGPVVAGAAILDPQVPGDLLDQLHDSKKLTEKKRTEIFERLQDCPHAYIGVGEASLEEIDRLNIRNAGLLAMTRAVENLPMTPTIALVDGTGKPELSCPLVTLVKGDQRSYSVAAASIVAKVTEIVSSKN